jgi:hypothetical protein
MLKFLTKDFELNQLQVKRLNSEELHFELFEIIHN